MNRYEPGEGLKAHVDLPHRWAAVTPSAAHSESAAARLTGRPAALAKKQLRAEPQV